MKTKTLLFAIFAFVFLLASIAPAKQVEETRPPGYTGSMFYDFQAKSFSSIVSTRLTTLEFGRRAFTVDVNGFAGYTFKTNRPVAGFSLSKSLRLDNKGQLYFTFGVGGTSAPSIGVLAGVSIRF